MDEITLKLTPEEAFVLRTLLFTRIAGRLDGPRGTLSAIETKLNKLGVASGSLTSTVLPGDVLQLHTI